MASTPDPRPFHGALSIGHAWLLAAVLGATACAATDSNDNARAPRNRIEREPEMNPGDTSSRTSMMHDKHSGKNR